MATIKVRYKFTNHRRSRKLVVDVHRPQLARDRMEDTSEAFRFSAAVAGFGLLLQHYEPAWDFDYDHVRELARTALGDDVFGHRGEFVELVKIADEIVR